MLVSKGGNPETSPTTREPNLATRHGRQARNVFVKYEHRWTLGQFLACSLGALVFYQVTLRISGHGLPSPLPWLSLWSRTHTGDTLSESQYVSCKLWVVLSCTGIHPKASLPEILIDLNLKQQNKGIYTSLFFLKKWSSLQQQLSILGHSSSSFIV